MAALTPTNVIGSRGLSTEFSGDFKMQVLTVVPTTASDTITLVRATDKITEILGIFAQVITGQDANLMTVHPTFSGLVITLTQIGADGLAATDWTGAVIRVFVIGR